MKSILPTFILSLAMLATPALAKQEPTTKLKKGTLILSARNTVSLRTAFTSGSVSQVVAQILEKDKILNKKEPIYLVLDTPGGSVGAGLDLIEAVKGLDREVRTVTTFAASMGFITAQSLGKRYITETGILMSHRARGGVNGQIPGELNVRVAFWSEYLKDADRAVAKRLGLTADELLKKHYDEWWLSGKNAVKEGAADMIVKVRCGQSLTGTYVQNVRTMFGNLKVTWSNCPMVKAPISISREFSAWETSEQSSRELDRAIHTMFYDKKAFLDEFVLTNKYSSIFQ